MTTETHPAAAAPLTLSHRDIQRVLSGLMLGMLLAALDQTIVATALPTMARDLGGIQHMSWVVSVYLLTSTATTPLYGKLSDVYGRRILLLIAIGIFLVASCLCALAQSMTQLIIARAIQGLGGGGLISLAHVTVADIIAPRDRGRYQGYFSGVFAAASVAGPVLGGLFADHLSWRWVFWINLPIGAIALVICGVALRKIEMRRPAREIDYRGALLLVAAVTALLLATSWGGVEYDWTSPQMLGLVAAGMALLASFWLCERLASEPILPPRLFSNRVYTSGTLIIFLSAMAMLGGTIYLPLFLQLVAGASAAQSGLELIPFTGGIVIGAYTSGRLIAHIGRYKLFPIIGLIVSVIGFALLAYMDRTTSALGWAAIMAFLGVGIGLVQPAVLVAIQNAIDLRDLGAGTASVSFFRSMGGSFGVAMLGSVLLARLATRLAAVPGREALGPHPALDLLRGDSGFLSGLAPVTRTALESAVAGSFTLVFLMAAAVTALALVVALVLRELPLRGTAGMVRPVEPAEGP